MGCVPHQVIMIRVNDPERYLCQISYRTVLRASCQVPIAGAAFEDEIPAWPGPVAHALVAASVPAVAARIVVADAPVAALEFAPAGAQPFVGSEPVSEWLLSVAAPKSAGYGVH